MGSRRSDEGGSTSWTGSGGFFDKVLGIDPNRSGLGGDIARTLMSVETATGPQGNAVPDPNDFGETLTETEQRVGWYDAPDHLRQDDGTVLTQDEYDFGQGWTDVHGRLWTDHSQPTFAHDAAAFNYGSGLALGQGLNTLGQGPSLAELAKSVGFFEGLGPLDFESAGYVLNTETNLWELSDERRAELESLGIGTGSHPLAEAFPELYGAEATDASRRAYADTFSFYDGPTVLDPPETTPDPVPYNTLGGPIGPDPDLGNQPPGEPLIPVEEPTDGPLLIGPDPDLGNQPPGEPLIPVEEPTDEADPMANEQAQQPYNFPHLSPQSQAFFDQASMSALSRFNTKLFDPDHGTLAELEDSIPTDWSQKLPDNPELAALFTKGDAADKESRLLELYGLQASMGLIGGTMDQTMRAIDIAEQDALRDYGGAYKQRRSDLGQSMFQAGVSPGSTAYQNAMSGAAGSAAAGRRDIYNQGLQNRAAIAASAADQMVALITGVDFSSSLGGVDAFNMAQQVGASGAGGRDAHNFPWGQLGAG